MQRVSKYFPVIGLEVHVEPKTLSKMFCACSAEYFGKQPNTHTCPVCLGLPGALPVPNKSAIGACVKIGLALGCKINLESKFDRKHYFYPDLPKGYQISQYDQPFCSSGVLCISDMEIRIKRVHMEEDTAKLIHEGGQTLIDFNRSGVPLIEIVSEPDISSPAQAKQYLQKLQQIIRYIGVSQADMEKGIMRCEANISLTSEEGKVPGYKVEIKNLNSFRSIERALHFEIDRQARLLDSGEKVIQETRGWDEVKGKTRSQRVKEEAQDYRYFPEPDIPPIHLTREQVKVIAREIPELPDAKFKRFVREYGLSEYNAEILTRQKDLADYFEEAVRVGNARNISVQQVCNKLINEKVDLEQILPAGLIEQMVKAKEVTVDEGVIRETIQLTLRENAKAVQDYQAGKQEVLGFLIGQVQKRLKGRGDPGLIRKILAEIIG